MPVLGTRGRAPVELIGQVAGVPGGGVPPAGPLGVKPPGGVTLLAMVGEELVVSEATATITAQYATSPAGPWSALSAGGVAVSLDGAGVKRSAGVLLVTGARADIYLRAVAPDGTTLAASRSAYDATHYTHARLVVDTVTAGAVSLVEVQFVDRAATATPEETPAPCEGDEGCSWLDAVYAGMSEDYSTYADAAAFEEAVYAGDDSRYLYVYGDGWSLTDGAVGNTYNCQPFVRSTRAQGYGWWTDFWDASLLLDSIRLRQAVRFPADWEQPDYVGPGFGTGFLTLAEFSAAPPFPETGFCTVGLGLAGDGLYLWTYVSGGAGYEVTKAAPFSALVTGSWREFRLWASVTQDSEEVGQLHAAVQWGAPCALVNSFSAPNRWVNPRMRFESADRFNHTYEQPDGSGAQTYDVGPWRISPGSTIELP